MAGSPQTPSSLSCRETKPAGNMFPRLTAAGGLHVSQGSPASLCTVGGGDAAPLSRWLPQAQPSRWSFRVSKKLLVQTLMPGLQLRAEILQLPGESRNSCEAGSYRDLGVFQKAQSRAYPPAPPPKL